MRPPFAQTFAYGEVNIRYNPVEACIHKICLHVGKVCIPSIVVGRRISPLLFHSAWERREIFSFRHKFHYRRVWLTGITAHNRHKATVCAEAVGIKVGKH